MRTMSIRVLALSFLFIAFLPMRAAAGPFGPECDIGGTTFFVTITGGGTLNGTSGNDVFQGSSGRDVIKGNGGNDAVCECAVTFQ